MRSFVSALRALGWGVVGFVAVGVLAGQGSLTTVDGDEAEAIRPPAPHSPTAVLAKHADECWSGNQPALVKMPGHVIWQHPDGRTVYSKALTGPALDTLFADGNLPGQPIAFCK